MKLYYLSKIDNFNEIFSLELILPPILFNKIYKFENCEFNVSDEFITLYSELPKYTQEFFAIEVSVANRKSLIEFDDKIFIYSTFIEVKKCSIIFANENIKKRMLAQSALVLEIKNMSKEYKKYEVRNGKQLAVNSIKKQAIQNIPIENKIKEIILYDRLIGAIYYAVYKNKASIIADRQILQLYYKFMKMKKIKQLIEREDIKITNTKKGIAKDISTIENHIIRNIQNSNKVFIKNNLKLANTYKFNLKKDEMELFYIILNCMLNNINLKDIMRNIGEQIKINNKEYLNEYKVTYDICINGNIKHNIGQIQSVILRSFTIGFLKSKNIEEIDGLSEKYNLKGNIYPFFFAGLIKRYSNISKVVVSEVEKDKIANKQIDKEISNLIKETQLKTTKRLYEQLLKFKKSKQFYKFITKNIYHKFENLKCRTIRKGIFKLIIAQNNYEYNILFGQNKTEEYKKILNETKLVDKAHLFKNIKIRKKINNKLVRINNIDEENITLFIEKIMKDVNGGKNEYSKHK